MRTACRGALAVIALAAVVAIGACGTSHGEQRPSTRHPATLTVWDWDYFTPGLKPYLAIVDKQFEAAHPGVTVNHVAIPYESASERYHAAVAVQRGPDVITMFAGAYSAPFRQGLMPLEKLISTKQRREWEWLEDAVTTGGRIYVIPFASEGYGLVYNKRLFARAGVAPPATWSEWLASCEKLRAAGITPQAGGWKDGEHFSDYYQNFSDALLSPAEMTRLYEAKLPLTGSKFVQAIDDFLELQKHGCFQADAAAASLDEADALFAAGKAASVLQSLAFGPLSRTGAYPRELGSNNIGVVPVPLPPGAATAPFMSSGPRSGWAITRWSRHQRLAWEYISYVMRRQSFELAFAKVELLPSVRGYRPVTSYPPAQQYLGWLEWPHNNSTFEAYPQDVYEVLTRQAASLSTGGIGPQAVLQQMQATEQQDRAKLIGLSSE